MSELHQRIAASFNAQGLMTTLGARLVLVQDGDAVTGAVFQDVDGAYHQINAKAVVVAAGDFGGNPDMRLDLSDQMRNLAWSYGNDRTDATSIGGMGRDGSGIRMCMWAGGTMEGGAVGVGTKPNCPALSTTLPAGLVRETLPSTTST